MGKRSGEDISYMQENMSSVTDSNIRSTYYRESNSVSKEIPKGGKNGENSLKMKDSYFISNI